MSTGERFRATLARKAQLAAQNDTVLVVDDFAANLDTATARCCAAGLASQLAASGVAAVFVSGVRMYFYTFFLNKLSQQPSNGAV